MFGIPVGRQFVGLEQAHLAAFGCDDARLDHAGDAGVLGLGKRLGHAVLAFGEAELLEPRQRPAAVGVEVAFLLGQRLSRVWLMSASASRTESGLPSASSTLA